MARSPSPVSLRSGLLLSTAAIVALGLVAPFAVRSAAACSPLSPPPGYGSLIPRVPAQGATDVPTNGVVILDSEVIGGQPKGTTVSVVEDVTGAAVPGEFAGYYWDRSFIVWRPAKPLQPQTAYRVAATVTSEVPRPSSATGAAELSLTFTTGSGPVPAIESSGQMQVQLETYMVEREDWSGCPNLDSCGHGTGCVPRIVYEKRTRARVTVPSFSGGLSEPGYYAFVYVTADSPYQFPRDDKGLTGVNAVGSSTGIKPNVPSEILIDDLDRVAPYRPCFALRVTDLAGTMRDVDPVCLDSTVQPGRRLDQSGGCRVAGSADATVWGGAALLGLLWHARRRRRSPTS